MKLSEEDISKVFVVDLPVTPEYSSVINNAFEAGKLVNYNFEQSQQYSDKAWHDIVMLIGACIARGMRLQRERVEEK